MTALTPPTSPLTGASRVVQRVGVALLAANEVHFWLEHRAIAQLSQPGWSSPALYRWIGDTPWSITALAALAWLGCIGLAAGRAPLAAAGAILVAMHLLGEGVFGTMATLPPRSFLIGLLVLGWFLGLAAERALRGRAASARAPAEALAEQLAFTAFCGGYVCAGLAKFVRSGLHWDHRPIWHVIACSAPVDDPNGVGVLTALANSEPRFASAAAALTMFAQLGLAFAPFGARRRVVFGAAIALVHAMMWAVGGLYEYTAIVVIALFCVRWTPPRLTHDGAASALRRDGDLDRLAARAAAVALLVLAIGAALRVDRAMATRATYPLHIWQPWLHSADQAPTRAPLTPLERRELAPLVEGARYRGFTLVAATHIDDGRTKLRWRGPDGAAAEVVIDRPDPFTGVRAIVGAGPPAELVELLLRRHPPRPHLRWPPQGGG